MGQAEVARAAEGNLAELEDLATAEEVKGKEGKAVGVAVWVVEKVELEAIVVAKMAEAAEEDWACLEDLLVEGEAQEERVAEVERWRTQEFLIVHRQDFRWCVQAGDSTQPVSQCDESLEVAT